MEPTIIFEDNDLLVINKPAGITVNSSDTTKGEETVHDWIEQKSNIKNQISKINESSDFLNRAGIVHRLDKETSGILLIAKNPEAFANLQAQFKQRKVKKTYIALVHGKPIEREGEIRVPIGRLPWNRKQFGVLAGGRDAVTRYRVISNFSGEARSRSARQNSNEQLTLLELYPETGRTHQIRVHLKYAGHPIFGDSLYAGRKTSRTDRKILSRVFLHAAKISFTHPKSGEVMALESPLPSELQELLDQLEAVA